MEIQDKIRSARKLHRMTIEEMAEKLNMSASGYAKIERGETKLQFEKLTQIAQIFNMDLIDLLTIGDKNLVFLMNENGDFSANYYSANEAVISEIEKLKISIFHKDELLTQKDRLIKQQENEISALKELVSLLREKS